MKILPGKIIVICISMFLLPSCVTMNQSVDQDGNIESEYAEEVQEDALASDEEGSIVILEEGEQQENEDTAAVEEWQDIQQAPDVPAVPAGSREHKVWIWQETGDCLWTISKQYYGDPWKWKKIYLANQDKLYDPNIIFPKQVLVIPPDNE